METRTGGMVQQPPFYMVPPAIRKPLLSFEPRNNNLNWLTSLQHQELNRNEPPVSFNQGPLAYAVSAHKPVVNLGTFRGSYVNPNCFDMPKPTPWLSSPAVRQPQLLSPPGPSHLLNAALHTAFVLAKLNQPSPDGNVTQLTWSPQEISKESCSKSLNKGKELSRSPLKLSRRRSSNSDLELNEQRKQLHLATECVSESDDSGSERDVSKPSGLRGERRLVISFDSLGRRGKYPQTFGKSGAFVPDGVSGSHTVYNERWKFEITHGSEMFTVDKMDCICVTWKITNLTTGHVTSITETRDEAVIRNSQGQTITNKVFREALEARARDLETTLEGENNPKRIAQIQALVRSLRPKRFSEGPLIFGLQHKAIQERMIQSGA